MLLNATISSQALSTFMCHHSSFLTPLKCCLHLASRLHLSTRSPAFLFPKQFLLSILCWFLVFISTFNDEVPQSSAFASLLSLPTFTSLVIFFLTALNASYTLIIPTILPVCLTFSPFSYIQMSSQSSSSDV